MSLFQKAIINKYLKTQNQEHLNQKWDLFCKHFHNAEIQENIRNSKEEQYQGEFLIDLFVNVLGYIKNPTPNFNLTTEYKNVKDSKKADGAIIINDKVLVIIELKGTDTTDLGKVETQAFGYKNNQPDCKYVITSNFEKLRFYIDNAIEHLEFNLFELTKEQFELLYLCLAYENISADIPSKIKNESVSKEDEITKKLYKDYSVFKRELFQNLIKQNPEFDQLELFKKSQKLLDRLLFLFFGEDRGLLPPNSVRLILEQWNKLKDLDEYVPLYDRFKKYFGYLNTGFKGKQFDVFAYNGGLFKTDEILDNVIIADDVLYNHTLKLADYDFASEVDVNILGHIFENSLNEIDEIKAQLAGQEIDKSKTKRKKDGVFYTPKYITKYIVENTVGKLCEEKKTELRIVEEDYFTDKKRQQKTKLALLQKLQDYRTWLHQITIIDPACGSGAFLNEALNFLIEEHKYIDELEAKLTGSSIAFTYHSESILENNLFGVDLNEESVEIAKLSLWLRTAEPNRKLNDLSNNIKCGNSLIDDPEIAGSKSFNWEKEFPQIFAKGGFDVVIGNPPYVRIQNLNKNEIDFYFQEYKYPSGKLDISILFFEKAFNIIKDSGIVSFISSSQWLQTDYGKNIRNHLSLGYIKKLIDFGSLPVFFDADTYPAIFIITKKINKSFEYYKIKILNDFITNGEIKFKIIEFSNLSSDSWNFNGLNIVNKLNVNKINYLTLQEIASCNIGDLTGMDKAFIMTKKSASDFNIENDIKFDYAYRGEEVEKYTYVNPNSIVIYPYIQNEEGKTILIDESEFKIKYPNAYNFLIQHKDELMKRIDSRKLYALEENWYRHLRQGNINYYLPKKIVIKGIGTKLNAGILEKSVIFNGANCPSIIISENTYSIEYLLCILNSKIISFHLNSICPKKLGGYYRYNATNISELPIIEATNKLQIPFIEKADQMLSLNKELQETSSKFKRNLQREFSLETLSKKLQNWYELSFADFLKELAKAKINLSLSQKADWEDYFLQEQKRALDCQSKIHATDKEIDQMVYELYGLTEEEIEIVEKS